jgi:predicted Zn-dependent protease
MYSSPPPPPPINSAGNDVLQNAIANAIGELVKEALELYDQYVKIIQKAESYWEDEIKNGLSEGRYTDKTNDRQYLRIKTIFDRLLSSQHFERDKHTYNWKIYLQYSNEVNAFAALNGIIIINKNIIDFCQNDDELALVIGHEMAHITEGHAKKQLVVEILKEPIIKHIASLIARKINKRASTEEISDKEISDKELFQLIFGLTGELALLTYSRSQEVKADAEGAKFAASVGYDTDKGYDFWKRMVSISNDSKWLVFLSAHPHSEKRAETFLKGD